VLFIANMTPGYIRDLSRTGCQISFVQAVQANVGEVIEIQVVAGGEPQIVPFALRVLIRWVKSDGVFFSLGGEFVDVPTGAKESPFARLVDYYQGKESAS
jgi:hypothetical protein